jgi:hypothetical protein
MVTRNKFRILKDLESDLPYEEKERIWQSAIEDICISIEQERVDGRLVCVSASPLANAYVKMVQEIGSLKSAFEKDGGK